MIYNNITQKKIDFTIVKLNKEIDHMEQIVAILSDPEIMEIFKKWQGKQYTKRMLTSLNKKYNCFYVDSRVGLYLEMCFYSDRYIRLEQYNENCYIEGRYGFTCMSKNVLFEEKTIIENLAEKMESLKTHFINEITKMKKAIEDIPETIREFEEIKEKYNKFEDATHYSIRKELQLNLQSRN